MAPSKTHSVILEVFIGTIYNVICGHNASRVEMLFNFLIELALKWNSPLIQDDDGSKAQFLELGSAILAKTISYNSQAHANETIPVIVGRILELVNDLDRSEHNFWTLQARNHLEYIRRRLGVFNNVARNNTQNPQILSHGKFVLSRPRHDNDHEDITKIRILPTIPPQDPTQLHLPGIQGLIDRHFRLLREDMVGQLKDCIAEELRLLEHGDRKSSANLQNHIIDIKYTRRCGLEFRLKIEQPSAAGRLAAEARADWWSLSKRLEIGALVCLLEENTAVFCVVAESTLRPKPTRQHIPNTGNVTKQNLYSNQDFAYVNLNLAEPKEVDLKIMLSASQSNEPVRRSLVEFPGVLLPSFKPTLSALQQVFKTLDLPFAEFLAPRSDGLTELDILPPLYASKPEFYFNLACLTNDGKDLRFSPRDSTNPEELCRRSSLDEGQATALLNSLKRNLALIQGPPGTGKSYTGEAIIKALLANKEQASIGPIICVCYTNHALDQLLEHLFNGGVEQIIRIGSRSKSSVLTNLNLRTRNASWKSGSALKEAEDEMKSYLTKLKTSTIHEKVKGHIKANELPFYNDIFGMEEGDWDKVTHKDNLAHFMDWVNKGRMSDKPVRDIDILKRQDPSLLSQQERFALCTAWGSEVAAELQDEFVSLHNECQEAKMKHDTVAREVDLRILQEADIVGVTTTGLAQNLDMLRKLDSKVLICEEAGEVLESHILTALIPSVEHAILIGDHLQLRPQISDYELSVANPRGQQYSLDVSLFERLVQPARPTDLKLPFDMLEIQRRMHPSISSLIRDTVYETLKDAEKVNNYPEVVGMLKRLFWFDHGKLEARSDPGFPNNTSRTNDFEIEIVSALVSHLVRQGTYGRDDIAILTPYLGQLHKLRKKLQNQFELVVEARDLESLQKEGLDTSLEVHKQALGKCIRLATVDNFQGEEAKVVIISLVRSNLEHQCGFLKTTNRINVLLSRAQHGMYIVGNSSTYRNVEMWEKVISILDKTGCIGQKLPLQCPRHKNTSIEVSEPDDFVRLSPEAGCSLQCSEELDCGHICRSKCHADPLHRAMKCPEPCHRLKSCCHSCPKLCGEDCEERCSTVLEGVIISLPCGHTLTSPQCWQIKHSEDIRCITLVEKVVPSCYHSVNVPCHEDVSANSFVCPVPCGQPLPCGHTCQGACEACRAGGGTHPPCSSICGRSYSTCKHSCGNQCHPDEECVPCVTPCDSRCAHTACSHPCSEPCNPCMFKCSSACVHSQCSMPCSAPCDWIPCSKRCNQHLPCGHQCPSVCGESCPDVRFCQICASEETKAVVVDIYPATELQPCLFLDCGHIFTVTSMDMFMGTTDNHKYTPEDSIGSRASTEILPVRTIKFCPQCKGTLRNISRYGTIVRRSILVESTRRFVTWSRIKLLELEGQLIDEQERLTRFEMPGRLQESIAKASKDFYVTGNTIDQLLAIHDWLYFAIVEYLGRVASMEQSYYQLYGVTQRNTQLEGSTKSGLDIRTRAQLTTRIVLFRCYLTVISDFVYLRNSTECGTFVKFNLSKPIEECKRLVELAQEAKYPRQEAEGHIFYSKLVAMARHVNHTVKSGYMGGDEYSVEKARNHLSKAKALILELPSAAYLLEEIQAIRGMLVNGVFFRDTGVEEKRVVWKAMTEEVKGDGHWYVCVWGHPFMLLDGSLLAEPTKCTECGAHAKELEKC
ncbi:P-loop containing nucleoside triphosphate hydrolase protein [Daldinia eschscholtzii]|nr:P-loop containing nucleoside triphosphate hydrolase protein [Daldinia eschscholtzii]